MKLHRFVNPYFYNGQIKYHAGSHYAPNDETTVAVAAGHAEVVEGKASQACHHYHAAPPAAAAAAEEPPAAPDKGEKKKGGKGSEE